MAVTISLYNHTARHLANGTVVDGVLRLVLCSAATFDATDATLGDVVKTVLPNGVNGYSEYTLEGVTVTTVATNDAKLDASDVVWIATGGSISAAFALLYFVTVGSGAEIPLAFINFDGTQTAADGTEFKVAWNAGGIFTFTVA